MVDSVGYIVHGWFLGSIHPKYGVKEVVVVRYAIVTNVIACVCLVG
jgi:hypothetical protein